MIYGQDGHLRSTRPCPLRRSEPRVRRGWGWLASPFPSSTRCCPPRATTAAPPSRRPVTRVLSIQTSSWPARHSVASLDFLETFLCCCVVRGLRRALTFSSTCLGTIIKQILVFQSAKSGRPTILTPTMSVKYIYQWLSEFLTMVYWTNFWNSMHRCFGKFLWKSTIEAGSNYHLPKQKIISRFGVYHAKNKPELRFWKKSRISFRIICVLSAISRAIYLI